MKIGSRDIRHLAIIGAAGAAGVLATLAVVNASERPHVRHEVITVDRAPVIHIRSNVHVVEPVRERADQVVRERLRRVEVRSVESMEPVVYIDGVRVQPRRWWSGAESAPGIDDLNPEDIAKIDVVKGDKARERFGTEGAEKGVILVTTKEGSKKGSAEKKGSGEKKDSGEEAEKGP